MRQMIQKLGILGYIQEYPVNPITMVCGLIVIVLLINIFCRTPKSNRAFGKIGLLLTVVGFFMPVFFQMNGFQYAKTMMNSGNVLAAVFLYILFISAIAGCVVGVLLSLADKRNRSGFSGRCRVKMYFDWISLLVCIGSGILVFFNFSVNNDFELQTGAYIIVTGWGVTLISQLVLKIRIIIANYHAYLEAERKRREEERKKREAEEKFYDFLDGAGAFLEGVWTAVTFWVPRLWK
jgi:hypothetical protein